MRWSSYQARADNRHHSTLEDVIYDYPQFFSCQHILSHHSSGNSGLMGHARLITRQTHGSLIKRQMVNVLQQMLTTDLEGLAHQTSCRTSWEWAAVDCTRDAITGQNWINLIYMHYEWRFSSSPARNGKRTWSFSTVLTNWWSWVCLRFIWCHQGTWAAAEAN